MARNYYRLCTLRLEKHSYAQAAICELCHEVVAGQQCCNPKQRLMTSSEVHRREIWKAVAFIYVAYWSLTVVLEQLTVDFNRKCGLELGHIDAWYRVCGMSARQEELLSAGADVEDA